MATTNMHGLKNTKAPVDENVEQEEQTFMKRLMALRDRLKLGPHYRMERFSALLGATLAFLLLFTVISFASYRSSVSSQSSSQAIYNKDFTFSKSGQMMHVDGVYGNKAKTDVMILLRMDDPKSMSTDAKNYRLFITGENGSLSYQPKVSFSLFGSTGYGIIRFRSSEPMRQEIMNITIRANAQIADTASSDDGSQTDASFKKYDQGTLYVNPGADKVKTLTHYKTGETNPSKLYVALVADKLDAGIHKAIKKTTSQMSDLLNRAKEYRGRLTASGYVPPKTPWFVAGDKIENGTLIANRNLAEANTFDYTTKTIRDGYLNQVMDHYSELNDYLKHHQLSPTDTGADTEQVPSVQKLKAVNGATLDLSTVSTDNSPAVEVAANDAVQSLTQTWQSYVQLKSTLQRDELRQLLMLDADVQSQHETYSLNTRKHVAQFY